MTNNETLRKSILQQSNPLGSKRRFGLFSQPLSTAIGDDGAFKVKIHPRNQMGKPVTELRNIFASPIRRGQSSSTYFGPLNPLSCHERKDIFMEEGIRLLKEEHQSFMKGKPQTSFFPIAGIKPITNSAYEYITQQNPELDPKRFKEADGRVRSGPKNLYSNPQSKVIDQYFKSCKYIEDPYERKHEQEKELMKKERSKEHESKFIPNKFSSQILNKSKVVYGYDSQITKMERKEQKFNVYNHQNPWKSSNPTKQGVEGLFHPVHKYIESPPIIRVPRRLSASQKESFKGMNASLTTPTPSISLNRVNMMKSISPKRK